MRAGKGGAAPGPDSNAVRDVTFMAIVSYFVCGFVTKRRPRDSDEAISTVTEYGTLFLQPD